jgi:type I restriction enzyme S subunit
MVPKGTVLLSSRAPIGLLSIAGIELCTNQGFKNIIPREGKVDSEFLYYYLKIKIVDIERLGSGTTFKEVSKTSLEGLDISVPDISTQQKIAAVLSALDAKIELNQRINAELSFVAKTLYDYWFVQNTKVGKLKVGKLGDFIEVNARSITKNYPHSEIEYIDIASVSTGRLEGTTKYEIKDAPSRARRLVKHGDTIWSTVRPNRKSYLFICNPSDNLVVSTGFAVLTPKDIPPSFLYFFTTTEQFVNYLVSNAEGSAYPAVSADRFAEIEFSIPPENKLIEFENIVNPMLTKISENEKESQTLAELRDWLLPMLMNGQVYVS